MRAIILLIGDELLNGFKADSNGLFLAKRLTDLGITVLEQRIVPDSIDLITQSLASFLGRAELVFISGGLGPTVDDVTRQALAEFFGPSESEYYAPAITRITQYKQTKNSNMSLSPVDLGQAEILKVAKAVFDNPVGIAPAMSFQKNEIFWVSLPGVPREFETIVDTYLIPYLQANYLKTSAKSLSKSLLLDGISEANLSDLVQTIYAQSLPAISWAYLPESGLVLLRLSTNDLALEHKLNELYGQLKVLLRAYVVAEDKVDFFEYSKQYLRRHNLTIALAESCTGGALAAIFTADMGASDFFVYSAVVYRNEIKRRCLAVELKPEDDAVSEEVVRAMLAGVLAKSEANLGIAVSGYLTLAPNSQLKHIVWIAIGTKEQQMTYMEPLFLNNRKANREYILQRIGYRLYSFLRTFQITKSL